MTRTTSSGPICLPRFGTHRNPDRPTLGGRVADAAKALGTPLLPWQRHVAEVALEYDPDGGLLVYREVDLTVPRQCGKSTLLLAVMVHRALRFGGPQMIVYSAQSRKAALKKFRDEHVVTLNASTFHKRGLYVERKSNGSEAVLWVNGSIHAIDAPTEIAGHGTPLHFGAIDEAWAQTDDRVEQAMGPAMVAQVAPQLWVTSTAGNARSAYLYRKVIAGRANDGLDSPTAFFEWSADDDADPTDPATWRACIPALGHTITERTIRAELDKAQRANKLDIFRRAFLNQWTEIPVLDEEVAKVIPIEWWDRCIDERSKVDGQRVFAVDVTPDRATTAIVVVGSSTRGGVHVETVEHRPGQGSEWAVGRLVELCEKWPAKAVTAHLGGPVGSLEASLRAAVGDKFHPISDRELYQACGMLHDGIRDGTLSHLGDPSIKAALGGAAKSDSGDSWRWSRRTSTADISTLMAATAGWYAFAVVPDIKPREGAVLYSF